MKKYLMMILTLFLFGMPRKRNLAYFSYPYIESDQHKNPIDEYTGIDDNL